MSNLQPLRLPAVSYANGSITMIWVRCWEQFVIEPGSTVVDADGKEVEYCRLLLPFREYRIALSPEVLARAIMNGTVPG